MKKIWLISCVVAVTMVGLWFAALRLEQFSALRGLAQFAHLPGDFFSAGDPMTLRQVGIGRFRGETEFTPKYAGRYQLLVTPVVESYGATIAAHSFLSCDASDAGFQVESDQGRVEFDMALKLGFVGRMLTFDTSGHADVGLRYRCVLTIETSRDLDLRKAYVRKLTDT